MPSFWDVKKETTVAKPVIKPTTPGEGGSVLSVADVARKIKDALDTGLPRTMSVRGEIGSWNNAASGHKYFSLKDGNAAIDCKMWKSAASNLKWSPQAGQEVVVRCRADFWEVRGQLSLVATAIEPVGQGALELAFQQLVEKLKGEALFDADRKQPVPDYPLRIAIVTSLQAAGLADALKVLRRARWLKLSIYPAAVQGEKAAPEIVAAIDQLSEHAAEFDVLLLIRGGGSLEDLWCFNDERVARAIAACRLPIITGVGHETDTTIADFVADVRAHTPTEAATHVVRHWRNARDHIEQQAIVLRRNVRDLLRDRRQRLDRAADRPVFRSPIELVEGRRQQVDELQAKLERSQRRVARDTALRIANAARRLETHRPDHRMRVLRERLAGRLASLAQSHARLRQDKRIQLDRAAERLPVAMLANLRQQRDTLGATARRLDRLDPAARLSLQRERLDRLADRLLRSATATRRSAESDIARLAGQLRALDPTAVLGRGYSITTKKDGRVVRTADEIRAGDVLLTRLADGVVESTAGTAQQMDLFEK